MFKSIKCINTMRTVLKDYFMHFLRTETKNTFIKAKIHGQPKQPGVSKDERNQGLYTNSECQLLIYHWDLD